ncbi:MAG: hypothetical protein WBB15_18080 [Ornithinimicrobium sp.]
MNTAHHGPAADDTGPDPTGMREVLAALPDPGPMPDHVVARIQQSMANERADASAGLWPLTSDSDSGTGPVAVDLLAERQRRRPAQWLLAVAAVVSVGVVGTVVFDQVLAPGSGADGLSAQDSPEQGENASSEEAAAEDSDALEGNDSGEGEAAGGASAVADDAAGDEGIDQGEPLEESTPAAAPESLVEIDDGAFAVGALLLLQGSDAPFTNLPAEFAGTTTPDRLSPASVENCVQAVGEDPDDGQWAAAQATINGSDAVVVGDLTPERSQAWAVAEHCPQDSGAEILHGPVTLP